ncbi:MAG: septum formation initiator family protein [Ktedonobacteraceae bacterium]|nr:septum formation initiator family protein [Ktedonobacteraceae bacterium]
MKKLASSSRSEGANVTAAVGMGETAGRLRARRSSLFMQTVMWITALTCVALLLGSLAQAWSNGQLMQRVQDAQQQLQSAQRQHDKLLQLEAYYNNPSVIENEARQQLGYIRPGEHPVLIISTANDTQQQKTGQAHAARKYSFWQKWWNSLFGG